MRYPTRKWILSENLFKTKIAQPKKVLSISDVINMTKNMSDCKKDLSIFTKESIEKRTIGQSQNELWFQYRKCLITSSKAHEVVTKVQSD